MMRKSSCCFAIKAPNLKRYNSGRSVGIFCGGHQVEILYEHNKYPHLAATEIRMNLTKFATIPIILFAPAMALACGPSSPTEYLLMGTMMGSVLSIPLLVLPIGLLIKFRANIQSRIWSLLTLAVAWAGGALSMGATSAVLSNYRGAEDFQAAAVMGGIALLVMTALTMTMYRIRARKVIAARG